MRKTLYVLTGVLLVSMLFGADGMRVTNPTAGSEWCLGSAYMIIWTPTGDWTNRVAIRLRRAGSADSEPAVLVITADTGRIDPFRWTIPVTVPPGDYFIRVRTVGRTGAGEVLSGDSPDFKIKSCTLAIQAHLPPMQVAPGLRQRTLTMPVTFGTSHKNKEKHQMNCLATMGTGPLPVPPTEFLVGFRNRCADRGPLCADECVSQIYRGNPLWDVTLLRPLVGKNIIRATLSFRHKSTEADPACANCLKEAVFYAGAMGDWDAPPSEVRPIASAPPTAYARIDVTEMMRSWFIENAPDYHGERHNYHMFFVGINERLDYNNQKCLSYFDSGSLEIKYTD